MVVSCCSRGQTAACHKAVIFTQNPRLLLPWWELGWLLALRFGGAGCNRATGTALTRLLLSLWQRLSAGT